MLKTLGPDAVVSDVLAELDLAGAVIVKDLIDEETIKHFKDEMMSFVDRTPMGRDDFSGKRTKRTGALAARSETCRELILNNLVLGTAEAFLKPFTKKIILHLTQTIQIHPGSKAQAIHRDRYAWGAYLPQSIEPQLNTIWAMTDFTAEMAPLIAFPAAIVGPGSGRQDLINSARQK